MAIAGQGLRAVTNELQTLTDKQDETTQSVESVVKLIADQIQQAERMRLDQLEAAAEASKQGPIRPKGGSGPGAPPGGGTDVSFMLLPLAGLMTALKTLAIPAIIAVTASITGFDDVIRGLTLPRLFTRIGNGFTRIADAFRTVGKVIDDFVPRIRFEMPKRTLFALPDSVKNFKFPELKIPPVFKAGDDGFFRLPESFRNFKFPEIKLPDSIKNFKFPELKMPDALKPGEGGFLKLPDSIKNFKFPEIKLPDSIKNFKFPDLGIEGIKTFFSGLIPKFIDTATKPITAILDFLPSIKVEIPPGLQKGFDKIKEVFGFMGDGDAPGKGLFGFIGKLLGFAKALVAPLAKIVGIAFGPITVAILGIIDFFVGFFEGFTGAGMDPDATFTEKLMAGLRGGVQGVIDGILEGFDFIFLEIPAKILDFMGLTDVAQFLRSLKLAPIFENVVNVVVGVVDTIINNFSLLKDAVALTFDAGITKTVNGFKNAFTRIALFFSNLGDNLYLIMSKNLRFKMPEVTMDLPFIGETTIIPGFDVGVGDANSQKVREDRIEKRNREAEQIIATRDAETARKLKEALEAQTALGQTMMNNINDLSNSNNTNNTSTTNNIGGGTVDVGVNTAKFVDGRLIGGL